MNVLNVVAKSRVFQKPSIYSVDIVEQFLKGLITFEQSRILRRLARQQHNSEVAVKSKTIASSKKRGGSVDIEGVPSEKISFRRGNK